MKILFHVHALDPGGAERQLAYLVQGLAERDWEIHVVTLYHGGHFWEYLEREHCCTLYSLDRKGKSDFTVVAKLKRYLIAQKIDILQGWMPVGNVIGSLAARWAGVPSFNAIRASKKTNYRFGERIYVAVDKIIVSRLSKATIFNSYAGLTHYFPGSQSKHKAKVIHNGLAFPGISFPVSMQNNPLKIGMIARLDPVKDHTTTFKALKLLTENGAAVELHLYGDGTDSWKNHLQTYAKALHVNQHIRWHGFTADVWQAYAAMDIVVSSSLSEGMPNTVLEAMAAKRPIVATDVGDTTVLLGTNRERGILIGIEDSYALADAIVWLMGHRQEAIAMGERSSSHVREQYSIDAMVDAYEHLYEQQLGRQAD